MSDQPAPGPSSLDKLIDLSDSHGHMPRGVGMVSGVFALVLGWASRRCSTTAT
ncbi:MAG: hypothetical protein Q8P18_19040 [Pseudomonadota bacterium]|nr:hypothetical protein [Pseudomonadota bacterium]